MLVEPRLGVGGIVHSSPQGVRLTGLAAAFVAPEIAEFRSSRGVARTDPRRGCGHEVTVFACHPIVDAVVIFWLTDRVDPITAAQAELDRAKGTLKQAVLRARAEGRTWADIGKTLGMTRQAAFKRFGQASNPATGEPITGALMSIQQLHTLTERVFQLLSSGDYASLEELLHADVRSELPEPLVMDTWSRVLAEVGALERLSDTHVVLPGGDRIEDDDEILGTVVGVTTLDCEAGEVMGRVAIDNALRVVGLLLVAPDHQPLPF